MSLFDFKASQFSPATWGLIFGGSIIAYGLWFRLAEIPTSSSLVSVFYLLMAAAANTAIVASCNKTATSEAFKTSVTSGLTTCAIAAIIYAVYVFGYNAFIDDSLLKTVMETGQQALLDQGKTGADYEAGLKQLQLLTRPGPFAVVIFLQMFVVGLAATLAIAASFWAWFKLRPA